MGTTRFLRLATVYVLGKHGRITLAITPVRPGESHSAVLNRLLHRVRMIGVRVERLWLDRGFATAAVVACRRDLRLTAVIGRTLDPQTVHRLYRHRFAIESSYRALGRVRARTTSRNIALRLLLIAVSFLLLNAWAIFAPLPTKPKRGPRSKPFRLFAFLRVIRSSVKIAFGLRSALLPPLLPRQTGKY